MVSWRDLEREAPVIADAGRALLERNRVALLGTLRREGWPRISPIEPYFARGELVFGAMTWSGKAGDLRRNRRCVLHNPINRPDAGESELKLYGFAEPATEPLREACRQAWWVGELPTAAEVYSLDVTEAVLISWDLHQGVMATSRWSPVHGLREHARRYP